MKIKKIMAFCKIWLFHLRSMLGTVSRAAEWKKKCRPPSLFLPFSPIWPPIFDLFCRPPHWIIFFRLPPYFLPAPHFFFWGGGVPNALFLGGTPSPIFNFCHEPLTFHLYFLFPFSPLQDLKTSFARKPFLLEIVRNDLCSYSGSDIPRDEITLYRCLSGQLSRFLNTFALSMKFWSYGKFALKWNSPKLRPPLVVKCCVLDPRLWP